MGFEHAFAAMLIGIFPLVAALGAIAGLLGGIAWGINAEIKKGRKAKAEQPQVPRVYTVETKIYEDDEL